MLLALSDDGGSVFGDEYGVTGVGAGVEVKVGLGAGAAGVEVKVGLGAGAGVEVGGGAETAAAFSTVGADFVGAPDEDDSRTSSLSAFPEATPEMGASFDCILRSGFAESLEAGDCGESVFFPVIDVGLGEKTGGDISSGGLDVGPVLPFPWLFFGGFPAIFAISC
ncbi:MAG TPA: hypothetical protein VGA56_21505 [Opitutaceae bacterium]